MAKASGGIEAAPASVDVVVIGGGMAGLAAADGLVRAGFTVHVIEAGPAVGGLGRSVVVGGEEVEAYYHHVFPQDRQLRDLVDRLGRSEQMEWRRASTGVLHEGRVYPFDSPLDLLRFKPLPFLDRLRLGFGSVVALVRGRGRRLENVGVGEAGPRWFGSRGYEVLWQPLLEGKFGSFAPRVTMAWLVARMRQRANARKSGLGDRLGYVRGGIGTIAKAYGEEVARAGVRITTRAKVQSVARAGDLWRVVFDGGEVGARAVVACVSGEVLAGIVELPDSFRQMIEAIPYRGVACLLLELDRPLGRHYWVNLVQRTDLACLAVIEHTNFIPAERYGGRHLVYLTHYVEVGGRAWEAGVDEIVSAAEEALRAINPGFERSWIVGAHLSRDRWAQPVPLVGGPMAGLPVETGLPGLFHASLAHVYPDDRGVSLALRLGSRVGSQAEAWLGGDGAPPGVHH
ncbi:MAG: FAD-dependent oxidoreductase [Candidatus Limnocylindrales bacterium]|jgi:protoporphyrinogen oxidase